MPSLKTITSVSVFLVFVFLAKSLLAIALRASMAALFGAGVESDAYFAAFTIPQFLSDFFIGGILFAAIIPVLQQRRAEVGKEEVAKNVSALLNLSLMALVLVTALYCALVPITAPLLFPGFTGRKLDLTIRLSWIFSPAIILMGLSLIYSSIYHSSREFAVPSIAALAFPVSSLASLWMMPTSWGIERLVYGNLVGSGLGLAVMIQLIKKQHKWQWNWNFSNPLIASTLLLSWPVLIEGFFAKCVPLIQKGIASGFPEKGAITIIELSLFIINSAVGFLSAPLSTALFPFWGQQKIENKVEVLFQSFFKAMGFVLFLATPCMIILLTESYAIVKLLYGHGKFSEADCALTASVISIVSLIVLPSSFTSLAGRLYFVFNDTKTISLSTILIICVSTPFYFLCSSLWGIYGLMGAIAATSILASLSSAFIIKIKHKQISFRPLGSGVLKNLTCGAIMVIVIIAFKHFDYLAIMPAPARAAVEILAGSVAYLISCHLLRLDGYRVLLDRLSPFFTRLHTNR